MTGVTPTSDAQVAAARGRAVPAPEEVRPGIHAIALEMRGMLPPYVYVYALLTRDGSRAVHLIDAGHDTDENWEAMLAALRGLGREIADVASVTVTHMHPDHLGLAPRIREASGAVLRMHVREAEAVRDGATFSGSIDPAATLATWGVPHEMRDELATAAALGAAGSSPVEVDEEIVDGALLSLGGYELRAIHTPGHTIGHLCLALARENLVFAGDHVLPGINPGIALGGERAVDPLGEYYASLDKLLPYDGAEVLPGHGYRFTGLAARCAEIRAHHGVRTREVAEVLAQDPDLSVWEVAGRITWSFGWENLEHVSRLSALAQTEMHIARVRAAG